MAQQKGAKKSFYEVKAPITSAAMHLYGYGPEEFNGKHIKLDLTRSLKGKSFQLDMKVVNENDSLKGEPQSIELAGSYVRRMIRKGTDYIEDSFMAQCRDTKVRVKPFMITRKKVSRAVRNSLRQTAKSFLEGYLKSRTAGEIFIELTTNKLQREMSLRLKKIYPLALCEVRSFEIISEKISMHNQEKKPESK